MKNNFTPQHFFSTTESKDLSGIEKKISQSLRKVSGKGAKSSTIRSLCWYAATIELKQTTCGVISEIVLN